MRINSVPDVKCFCKNKMCYLFNQWYDISCATLYVQRYANVSRKINKLENINTLLLHKAKKQPYIRCAVPIILDFSNVADEGKNTDYQNTT